MLLERADQAISATDLQRNAKALFDKMQRGEQDKYVVMRDNKPAFVMLPVATYEAMLNDLDELERLRAATVGNDKR